MIDTSMQWPWFCMAGSDRNTPRLALLHFNRIAINVKQNLSRRRPSDFVDGPQRCSAQLVQECSVFVQLSDLVTQRFHVSHAMHKGIFHVLAYCSCCLRNQQNASAAARLGCDERTPFFDAWQHQRVTLAHQLRDVIAMSQNTHARMSQ